MNILTWTLSESVLIDKAFVLRPINVGQGLFFFFSGMLLLRLLHLLRCALRTFWLHFGNSSKLDCSQFALFLAFAISQA